jgi:hypothetical protein
MSTTILTSVSARFQKAAESLKLQDSEVPALKELLSSHGIAENDEGLKYLNSRVIGQEDLVEILQKSYAGKGKFCVKAAAMYLKGEDPFGEESHEVKKSETSVSCDSSSAAIIEFIQANKPIGQMTDPELLALWDKNRDNTTEQELNRRAKGQPFIVLKAGTQVPGKEQVDFDYTIEMLKSSRKRSNPTIIPYEENTFASVYKISELNLNDRIIEMCPICGEILWKGYCSACDSNFAGVGDDERSYVKLIVDSGKINNKSVSDRKAVVTSASKGVEDLKITWPGLFKEFEEHRLTGNLPKLRKIANRPSAAPVADPFHTSGNRKF